MDILLAKLSMINTDVKNRQQKMLRILTNPSHASIASIIFPLNYNKGRNLENGQPLDN
jgi:hypothetical protein